MSKPLEQKQIITIANDLTKAFQDPSTSPSTYSALLSQLRTGVAATEDVLRSTKIGVTVNRLKDPTKVKDPGVRKEALELVAKWKSDINRLKQRGTASPKPAAASPSTNGEKKEKAEVKSEKMEGVTKGEEKWRQNVESKTERTADKDGADYKMLSNQSRNACIKLMYDALVKDNTDLAPSAILPRAAAIESAVHATHAPETSQQYKTKIRTLFSNVKSSAHWRGLLLSDPPGLSPEALVKMSTEELRDPEMMKRDEALQASNENNAKVAQEKRSVSAMLQCGQCKQFKVAYSQAQTRSADEPMTTFCECLVCGKRWKFS